MTYVRARNPREALEQVAASQVAPATLKAALPLSEALSELQGHSWRFASTMKDTPHEYTNVKHWGDPERFYGCVAAIRANGTIRYFRGWPYLELDAEGLTYWTMGYPIRDTTIINRRDQ